MHFLFAFILFVLAILAGIVLCTNPRSRKILRVGLMGPAVLMLAAMDVRKLHYEMQEKRKGGEDVCLKDHLAANYGGMSPEKLYYDLGMNLKSMTVDALLSTEENKWLFPEIFRDAIRKGLTYAPFYQLMVAVSAQINGLSVTMPFFNKAEAEMRDVAQGADITMGTLTWGDKTIHLRKKGRGFMQTYEALRFCPIALAAIFFEDLGTQLGVDIDGILVDTFLNGDQDNGSEAPLVIGATEANKLAYRDIARIWIYMQMIGRPSAAMLTNAEDGLNILCMDEFKKRNQGTTDVSIRLRTPLPTDQDLFTHQSVGAKKIGFVDPQRAFAQFTALPLMVETDRLIQKQWQMEVASVIIGFANIFSDARSVLDYSHAISENGFGVPWPTGN